MSSSLDTVTKNLMNKFLEAYEIESSDETRDFETFATYSAIKNNYSAHFEASDFENVLVGGHSDTGIDGIGIVIDNNLISDIEEVNRIIGSKESVEIKFIFVQTTVSKRFLSTKFRDFTLGVRELFYDYARPDRRKTKARNNNIDKKSEIASCVLEKTSLMYERPDCKLYYCLGNDIESKLGINKDVVEAEKEELLNLQIFDNVDINVIGTRTLHDLYRLTLAKPKVKIHFPHRIAFPEIEGVTESYIGRINFSEFKKLIIKELRQNMTPAEKKLWEHLRAKRFKGLKFRRQQIIEGFIVDFYCHSLSLIIEVDGEIHNQQKEYDRERDKILSAKDLHILRFTNQQVIENINLVLNSIAEKIEDIKDLRDLKKAKEESKNKPFYSLE